MAPEIDDPAAGTPPAADGVVAPRAAVLKPQPGLVVGLCSIATGLVGFDVPVVGMIASCAGIWLGISGFRQGRTARYTLGTVCGVLGISVSVLSIVFWLCAILFESYR